MIRRSNISVTLPADLVDAVDKAARKAQMPRSRWLEVAAREKLAAKKEQAS